MDFPRQKMRLTTTHGAKHSEEGWLVLDVRGMELEGLREIVISLAEVRELKVNASQQPDLLQRARSLLGGDTETEDEGAEE